jgi:hypothetical protein
MLSSEIQLEYGVCGPTVDPVLLILNSPSYISEFRVGTWGVVDVWNGTTDDCQLIHLERGVWSTNTVGTWYVVC